MTSGTLVTSNIYSPTVAPIQFANETPGRPRLSDSQLTGLSIADTLSVLDERVLVALPVELDGIAVLLLQRLVDAEACKVPSRRGKSDLPSGQLMTSAR